MEKQHRDKHRHTWLWHSRLPAPERRPGAQTDTLSRLGVLGDQYLASLSHARELGAEIDQQVEIAKAAGRSLAEISRAAGLSEAQIEYIAVSVHIEQQYTDHG
jgi:hypothetical protein